MTRFTNRDVADYYNQTLDHYRSWWHLNEVQSVHYGYFDKKTRRLKKALMRMNEVLAEFARINENDIVLDAGCGVGGSLFYLNRKFGITGTGITLSEKQVQLARHFHKQKAPGGNLTFLLKDYTDTGFASESFTVVWAVESITSTPLKEKFAKEAFRLLQPQGRLVIADYYKTGKNDKHHLLEKWRRTWSLSPFVTSNEFVSVMENAGFKTVKTENITGNIFPSSRRMFYASLLGALPSLLYNATHNTSRFAKTHYLSGIYQYKALKRNLWEYRLHLFEK